MGEYAKYKGEEIKIGTCEDMFYLRADQAELVEPLPGNVDPIADRDGIRFRFPFPDEDGLEPGTFWDRGFERAVPVPSLGTDYRCSTHPESPAAIVQQRWWEGRLVTVCKCTAEKCFQAWRLPEVLDGDLLAGACRREGDADPAKRDFWRAMADRVEAGYRSPTPPNRAHLRVVPAPEPTPAPKSEPRGFVGEKYEATKGLSRVEVAACFREDVKRAKASGELPKGLKVSVRCKSYSGGGSIHVEVTSAGALAILNPARLERDARREPHGGEGWMTKEARDLVDALETLLNAYNFDHSDSQSDYFHVRFYGTVQFATALTQAERKAWEEARKSTLDPHGEAMAAFLGED